MKSKLILWTILFLLAFATPLLSQTRATTTSAGRALIEPFDYQGVKLLESRWLDQFKAARDYYLNVSNDDILHGYRKAADLPAPGQPLGGWCRVNSNPVFGQWLSGMARIYKATGDTEIRDKAMYLVAEWGKTIGPDGNGKMDIYAYDKLVGGLVDMHIYVNDPNALPLLKSTLEWCMNTYSKDRIPASARSTSGRPGEWYTFGENLYRAYEVIGDERIKTFADSYRYPQYWNKFANTSRPADTYHIHAYSHINTFSSAAMAYKMSGDATYIDILRNAYDFMQETQCYATGGFGPMERILPIDGTLGRSLEARNASFETACGSWAVFKMTRYLISFTGEARYGDWTEKLFYNGIGSALPITANGKHFYYSDYRVTGGMKVYKVSTFACCAGTYIQCLADYCNLIYYKSPGALYVNLYVPSEVEWEGPSGKVTLTQTTTYPETETSTLQLAMAQPSRFELKFRVPGWAEGISVKVNGEPVATSAKNDGWGGIERTWKSGDKVEISIPMKLRMLPVDPQHPRRVAVVRGPVTLAMEDWVFEEIPQLPEPEDLEKWLVPDENQSGVFRIAQQGDKRYDARFRPFYMFGEVTPYRMYHDLDRPPIPVW